MKLKISLSGYAGGESNLVSLKNPVPNGDFHYYGMNPISHTPSARRLNEQLAPTKTTEADAEMVDDSPSTIKRRKKTESLAVPAPEGDEEELETNADGTRVLPNGADMYYGLKPIEHNPIMKLDLGDATCSSPIKLKVKE